MKCRICESSTVKEIELFSFRSNLYMKKWTYLQCEECGTLQIKEIPDDMGRLYNNAYESFVKEDDYSLKDKIFSKRYEACLDGNRSIIGRIVNVCYPYGNYSFLKKIKKTDAVLDIGCGRGALLRILYNNGYHNCKGIDPFLDKDIIINDELAIVKSDIFAFENDKKFDIVMLNHVFEHMENPKAVLERIKVFLKKDGMLSIEIPIVNEFLWEKYGVYIDSLDPPFHYFLYTKNSMHQLLEECGYNIEEYFCNVSPLLEVFANNAKNRQIQGRSLAASAGMTLKALIKNRKINKEGNGNIARFICRLKK